MSKRQAPIVRAGSGDSHEARLAVLEQRFSEEMQARCSWCNRVKSAKQGEWLEVLISSPGTGIRPAHVFRCLGCEVAPGEVGGGLVAVPSGARRPGQSPPPLPSAQSLETQSNSSRAEKTNKKSSSASSRGRAGTAAAGPGSKGRGKGKEKAGRAPSTPNPSPPPVKRRRQDRPLPATLSPVR